MWSFWRYVYIVGMGVVTFCVWGCTLRIKAPCLGGSKFCGGGFLFWEGLNFVWGVLFWRV